MAKKVKRQQVKQGFTYRKPDGKLNSTVHWSVESAQSSAAFASDRPYSHIALPDDWNRAYKQGFRIVRARLVAGKTHRAWKKPAKGKY